ncbi:SCO family protein [Natronosalvus rutilus]|uniref:SCO family protein n=1 Tax=Natronosalvus rutilus TaxID=2953753 RepID=A0A9E7NE76_9EURY|nr:SCO family protein [Natronosalvus rutilus]UTF55339.1 SCO family protein [Natronosalvus rutilus]
MDRRTYLGGLSTAGLAGVAGCLGSVESVLGEDEPEPGRGNWGDGQTALETPTEDRGDPVHPIYGQEMPSFSFPDPLTGETVSSGDLEGEKSYLMTFFYTSCPDGACPALLLRLRRAQADAVENDYVDDLDLLAITFDPERDTPEVLEEYAGQQGADLEVGNWHFLRPEDNETAHTTLDDTFGMKLERVEDHEAAGHGDGNESEDDEDHENDSEGTDGNSNDSSGHENDSSGGEHDHGDYAFTHINLILLVNEHGVVERSYPRGTTVDTSKVLEDVRTVVGQ